MAWPYWRARIRACLIDDLRCAHRFWSLRIAFAGVIYTVGCVGLMPAIRAQWMTLALFVAIALSRLLHQGRCGNG